MVNKTINMRCWKCGKRVHLSIPHILSLIQWHLQSNKENARIVCVRCMNKEGDRIATDNENKVRRN